MIKLFSLKQQSKDGSTTQSSRKTSAAYLRIQKGKHVYNDIKSSVYSPIDAADLPACSAPSAVFLYALYALWYDTKCQLTLGS